MSDAASCPRPGYRRPTALVVLVALLTALLSLTGTGAASAADPACSPLAVSSFGDQKGAVDRITVYPESYGCFTFEAEAPGPYLVTTTDAPLAYVHMVDAAGREMACQNDGVWFAKLCDAPAAGTYTVKIFSYSVSEIHVYVNVVATASTRGCAEPVGTRWDQPDDVRTTTELEVDCAPLDAKPGERIRFTHGPRHYGESRAWITDTTGKPLCTQDETAQDGCVLPGDGPYRVISRVLTVEYGFPAEYAVKTRRLDDPQGCVTAPVRPFGVSAPSDLSTNACYTFTADAAGPYTVNSVDEDGDIGAARIYAADGTLVCASTASAAPCRVPRPGTYTAVLDALYPYVGKPFYDARTSLVVLDRSSDAGCVPIEAGLYEGELTTPGRYDCLKLDMPQGAALAALTPLDDSGVDPQVTVVDRTGAVQCDADELAAGDCALTGTAPFRALVHASEDADGATGAYTVAFHRTDAASGCPVLPAGSFAADGAEAAFATGDGVFSQCLTIPADAHTGAELFQLIGTSGGVPAQFSVLDATGKKVCDRVATTNGWKVCALTPGVAHTVLVTGRDLPAGYTLTRRDVTATASSAGCTPTAAAKVGGPSVAGASDGPGTVTCHQITTAAATDVLHVNVRDALGTANIAVFGGDGGAECSYRNSPCAVTGSTTHQVLVQTPDNLKAAPAYHLDALRVATAAGPAPECTRVPSVSYGYGPVTGTLDEQHSAVCAVLPTAGFDHFYAQIKDTTGATDTAVPALYNAKWANGCFWTSSGYECGVGGPAFESAPTLLVLGLPEKTSTTAYSARLACAATLCGPDKVGVTAVSPGTGVAGTKVTLTVTGTALPANATVRLTQDGQTLTATTDSVSADNRTLKATVDLTGAAFGTWNVSVFAGCCEFQRGTFTVTLPQLTNTAPPKVTGTAKVGAKVTAAPGSWSAAPSSYTYQWKADGTAISGATASTYTVPASLVGKKLSVTVVAVRSGYQSGSATSAAVTVAKGDAPKASKVPVISGTAKVGRTLKSTKGTWSPSPTTYSYQWYANGKAISGATKTSLVLKAAQKGKKITVKVVAHRTGHKDGSAVSKATKAVAK
ncbi:Tat pathway signal protein [Streptomyces sp. NPDC088794]|uniref:Tat pathway signal protein n=1 Tax=Streptomyces sp. NPDC088794 TaxID=3365902 RepID=UPI00382B338C